ncbi:hypothetical protein A0H76_1087 [Hepatospora eriocheir]|uniref:Uncharacterized protein n=1 Tax=Hepatospora eriocheir TaxID=1081669 RepID=A0A1X0QHP2_9MICR|nr:hypothetical protein A0H76_1087 [Hepatospora eriocheir]
MKKKEFTKKETSDPLDKPISGDVDEDKGKDMDIFQNFCKNFRLPVLALENFLVAQGRMHMNGIPNLVY